MRVSAPAANAASVVDLHTHSSYSDGLLDPADLVRAAADRGLRVLGLTDHDTVAGLPEAGAEAARHGLTLVPGVELSTSGEHGAEIHLLGYCLDPTHPALLAGLRDYAEQRLVRSERILAKLASAGVSIDPAVVRRLAGRGTVGRPHVARALIETGHVASIDEAFRRYLGSGKPGFVPRPRVSPEDGIALIRSAGGVAVMAHPFGAGNVEAALARLVPAGLAGLEVEYGEYDASARQTLRDMANRWDLIATGGSDYHGPGVKAGRELGQPNVPMSAVARLEAAASPSHATSSA